MRVEDLSAYHILEHRFIEDLHSDSYLLEHKKSGARLALLSNDDPNKVFYIAFRTPPADSTGVAHIVEHTVLEGSRDFNVKDPFIELAKGSLNTFLNAMTYPDKTVYPIASCNSADFHNLMHVYLDAVFYPNIYKEKKIFEQEGWHYELDSEDGELTINGVVYNEMKGAFSSPDDVLDRCIAEGLFPDTPYANESGGDPECIPDLTYEQFLEFHQKYYHPCNSYIYLYGDMDMAERLDYMDRAYLSAFERIDLDSSIAEQKPFTDTTFLTREYPITEEEPTEENSYLAYNICLGDSLDRERYIAFDVLDYALVSAPGAPIKQVLLDHGIGKDVYSTYENGGGRQSYFSIVSKNTDADKQDEFIRLIEEGFAKAAEEGIDKKALYAGLNAMEFRYREADFGSYPAGLIYGLQVMDSWLYDDSKPFIHIEAGETFRKLREKAETNYYEDLIRDVLINNSHRCVISLVPVVGLEEQKEKELAHRLEELKNSMSAEELQEIIAETEALREYQETPDSREALECIPLLKREDMEPKAEPFTNEVLDWDSITVLYHRLNTKGISYFRYVFDVSNVPEEMFAYVGILKGILGLTDTARHTYSELFHEINIQTGGMGVVTNIYNGRDNSEHPMVTLELKCKTLDPALDKAVRLSSEILLESIFEDDKRLYELIAEMKSHLQSSMISGGHNVAVGRAMSYFSEKALLQEYISGMPHYRLVDDIEQHFSDRVGDLKDKLKLLCEMVFRPENMMVDFTGSEEALDQFLMLSEPLTETLYRTPVERELFCPKPERRNEAFQSASQVQYVCCAGNFATEGLSYTGALRVLKVQMSYEYLWQEIRVKGGAYGCMCSFGKRGESMFVSYRDPNLAETIDVYQKAADYIASFDGDERTITQYIIGAVAELDTPMNPPARALRSMAAYLNGTTYDKVQEERDQVINCSVEDIRALAAYVRAFMSYDCLCVVGNENKIKDNRDLFMNMERLY